jgi:hypothetical protein
VEVLANEGVLEDDGVEAVLERKCSMFATSLTSYVSETLRFFEDALECDSGVPPGEDVGVVVGVGLRTAIVRDAMPTSNKTG